MNTTINQHIQKESRNNFVINLAINGAIAWFTFKQQHTIFMWGDKSFAPDLLITVTLLSLILSAIVMLIHRKKAAKGTLNTLTWRTESWFHRILKYFPENTLSASLYFALAGFLLFGLPTIAIFYALGVTELTALQYAIFKGIWTGVIAALLIPPVITLSLARD